MSKSHISAKLRQQVAEQSRDMCCYCQSQQRLIGINLTVEHIIPESLGGTTTVVVLKLNRPVLLHSRSFWIEADWHPPLE